MPIRRRSVRRTALFLKRVLPPARSPRGERRLEIVEQHLTVAVARPRHAVPLRHPLERVVPLAPRLSLLRNDLESMTGSAGVKRLLAAGAVGIVLRAFIARRERGRLRGGWCSRKCRRERHETGGQTWVHAMRIAMRCIGLPPSPCGFQLPATCGCMVPRESVARVQ